MLFNAGTYSLPFTAVVLTVETMTRLRSVARAKSIVRAAVIVTLLVGVAGWQTREAQQRRVETIATLATSQGEGDLLPAVVFLGDATPEAGKAPRRRRSAPASPSFSSSWPDSCRARPRSSSIACSSSAASSSPRSRSLRAPSSILSLSRIKI